MQEGQATSRGWVILGAVPGGCGAAAGGEGGAQRARHTLVQRLLLLHAQSVCCHVPSRDRWVGSKLQQHLLSFKSVLASPVLIANK